MIEAMLIGFALLIALALAGYFWLTTRFRNCIRVDDREWLRAQVEEAERRHWPRKELRRRHVEATCRELRS